MSKVIADLEVGLAVDFLLNLAPSRETAEQSIAAAQEHLRDTVEGRTSSGLQELEYRQNVLASYLAQARSLLTDSRTYDLVLGAKEGKFRLCRVDLVRRNTNVSFLAMV